MCIHVDENDTAIGSVTKRDCHRVGPGGELILHRAFSVTFPGYFTNTCCSHPLFEIEEERNESNALGIKLAARRRLNFELGIPTEEVDPNDFCYLTRIIYKSTGDGVWGEHEVDYILFLQKDVTLNPNPDEVSELCYVPKNKLESFLSDLNAPITPWFNLIVRHRLNQWWDNLDNLSSYEDHQTIHSFK
ncbi:hypothetical protein AAG570_003119 [Ranatra chinensis]|uniref:isopentenyl-diphosphate Delta-isomerase n=1 Tax=Ranatra chinensis TaxID=642074 RepID=A0ABD0Y5U2_9HEMI